MVLAEDLLVLAALDGAEIVAHAVDVPPLTESGPSASSNSDSVGLAKDWLGAAMAGVRLGGGMLEAWTLGMRPAPEPSGA